MPSADVRRASAADAYALARLRWRFRTELAPPVEDEDAFVARCERWMRRSLTSPAWSAWLASTSDETVGSCWLQLVAKVPNPVDEAELHAYVTNEYVEPAHRGRGIGATLVAAAIESAIRAHVDEIVLWRSEGSRTLYARLGFVEPAPRVMTLRLRR